MVTEIWSTKERVLLTVEIITLVLMAIEILLRVWDVGHVIGWW